jgi:hypothetical protein
MATDSFVTNPDGESRDGESAPPRSNIASSGASVCSVTQMTMRRHLMGVELHSERAGLANAVPSFVEKHV